LGGKKKVLLENTTAPWLALLLILG